MIRRKSFWPAGHPEAVERRQQRPQLLRRENCAVLLVTIEQHAADGLKLILLGHVATGRDEELRCSDVDVEPGAGGLLEALARPPCGDVGLVGLLIFAEAD